MFNNFKMNIFAIVLKWVWKGYTINLDVYAPNDQFEGLQITIGDYEPPEAE